MADLSETTWRPEDKIQDDRGERERKNSSIKIPYLCKAMLQKREN